ncbi:heavy metal translocating P-type ATPase, partial [Phycisphaerales bacterium AB-hyl4]
GDALFAGTLNGGGTLIAEVTKLAKDNTLSKLIRLVEQAQGAKSPTQQLAERFERWYVPCVLGATVLLIVVPPLLGVTPRRHDGALWAGWFYQALAFLTAASPCALAIGTPAAILAGIGKAARIGVLIKGGVHLEHLAGVKAIAFDKTGTLTVGKPRVVAMQSFDEQISEDEMLRLAGSLELGSPHPLGRAIVDACAGRGLSLVEPEAAERVMAAGMRGRVEGRAIAVGRPLLFEAGVEEQTQAVWDQWREQGRTTVGVSVDGRLVGLIALMDEPRPAAAETIAALHAIGLRHTVMLTGDHRTAADAIARRLGITDVEAELMPQAKLERVRELDRKYGGVAMVGDGVNDAPALAAATVGLAVGGAGSANDVALETADVVLLADDLNKLPEAISLARFTQRIIYQNLFIAFAVIVLLAPMGAIGLAPISLAVLFHEGSTVVVVLNGLRILRHRVHP